MLRPRESFRYDRARRWERAGNPPAKEIAMTSEDLDLVTTDDLLNALGRRFDAVVLAAVRSKNGDVETRWTDWRGSCPLTAVGLCRYAERRLMDHVMNFEREPEP